ncbi:MAG TPA: ABC transporter permease subunit [Candidatus Dormibacteraeota bacterium]|nr:ABC transporter permease subunit [Candidatus Dormibacteraeota bacterium]
MAVWTIARLTFRETIRRRLLLALIGMTVLVMSLTAFGFYKLVTVGDNGNPMPVSEARLVTYPILILVGFMFSGVVALTAIMASAFSVSGDIDSGIMLAMLPRPLRRAEILLGKWLGLSLIMIAYTSATALIEVSIAQAITGFQTPHPFWLAAYMSGEGVVLVSLALLFSTRLPGLAGGIVGVVLFLMAWLGGVVGTIGQALNNSAVSQIGDISRVILPTDGLWRGGVYSLEPSTVISQGVGRGLQGNPFFAPSPPNSAYLLWVAIWVITITSLAAWSLSRRQI